MNLSKYFLEGIKFAALLGAITLVVWTMPEPQDPYARAIGSDQLAISPYPADR